MAYAVGEVPQSTERITRLEMIWTVGAAPKASSSFYSPWFGMDSADNMNLIQPVNPWFYDAWYMYTEYYQWSPSYNSDSDMYPVEAGQTLHGTLEYDASDDSYTLTQEIVETGVTSTQTVVCQDGKKFLIPYVVYEKLKPCHTYPPDGIVTFRNITVECDFVDCTTDVMWTAKIKDAHCNMTAHVGKASLESEFNEISITWDVDGIAASVPDLEEARGWEAKRSELEYQSLRQKSLRARETDTAALREMRRHGGTPSLVEVFADGTSRVEVTGAN